MIGILFRSNTIISAELISDTHSVLQKKSTKKNCLNWQQFFQVLNCLKCNFEVSYFLNYFKTNLSASYTVDQNTMDCDSYLIFSVNEISLTISNHLMVYGNSLYYTFTIIHKIMRGCHIKYHNYFIFLFIIQ